MSMPDELPLFPLNVVLFPGMPLPLHIFEERYKKMVHRCLATRSPFGVVLIRRGKEAGAEATEPYDIGTTAVATGVERLPGGDFNIATVGCDRFRIERVLQREPYLIARAAPYPFQADVPEHTPLAAALQQLLSRYVEQLARAVQQPSEPVRLPGDPVTLACLTAIVLQISLTEKQRILETASLAAILTGEAGLLRREIRLLDFMLRTNSTPHGETNFSAN